MKDLIIYYILILLPLCVLFLETNQNNSFVIYFLAYALLYRPIIDGEKLIKKRIIKRSEL